MIVKQSLLGINIVDWHNVCIPATFVKFVFCFFFFSYIMEQKKEKKKRRKKVKKKPFATKVGKKRSTSGKDGVKKKTTKKKMPKTMKKKKIATVVPIPVPKVKQEMTEIITQKVVPSVKTDITKPNTPLTKKIKKEGSHTGPRQELKKRIFSCLKKVFKKQDCKASEQLIFRELGSTFNKNDLKSVLNDLVNKCNKFVFCIGNINWVFKSISILYFLSFYCQFN